MGFFFINLGRQKERKRKTSCTGGRAALLGLSRDIFSLNLTENFSAKLRFVYRQLIWFNFQLSNSPFIVLGQEFALPIVICDLGLMKPEVISSVSRLFCACGVRTQRGLSAWQWTTQSDWDTLTDPCKHSDWGQDPSKDVLSLCV